MSDPELYIPCPGRADKRGRQAQRTNEIPARLKCLGRKVPEHDGLLYQWYHRCGHFIWLSPVDYAEAERRRRERPNDDGPSPLPSPFTQSFSGQFGTVYRSSSDPNQFEFTPWELAVTDQSSNHISQDEMTALLQKRSASQAPTTPLSSSSSSGQQEFTLWELAVIENSSEHISRDEMTALLQKLSGPEAPPLVLPPPPPPPHHPLPSLSSPSLSSQLPLPSSSHNPMTSLSQPPAVNRKCANTKCKSRQVSKLCTNKMCKACCLRLARIWPRALQGIWLVR
ncbi:hypothetical protein HYDPIDRAFT_118427 [Hydnomerulius pinastri MD-312]|uniref:Uncharacterized protein n=1 Tax=Hydnomerulius pinastri MD-312 TaxID=994086 RepID=A0A0C9VP93_9AGAM|nr:hypothetical protein HYDPIDRAFT_118427 [Hydnomerulius pinastri MD-312]